MEATQHTQPPKSTTAKAIVESIFRYKTRLLGTFAAVMTLVVLYVLFAPRQYQSEMNILVRNARPDLQITPEKSNGTIQQPDVTEERINSEIEVLRSRDVADLVIDPSWDAATVKGRTARQIKDHEKAVEKLNKRLKIDLLRKSNVIHVAYETRTPQAATDTVERLLAVFLLKQHELERSSGASTFFASEQERYKRELDAAQHRFAAYQQGHQIVSLSDKEGAYEQQIVDLQQQLRATEVQIAELTSRLVTGRRQLKTVPRRESTNQKTVPNILAMEQLGTLLTTLRNQRAALLTKFPETDRYVLEVDHQIANTTEALHQARDVNASENSTDINPVWQQTRSSVAQNTIELAAAKARSVNLSSQLSALRARLVATEGSTVEFNTLQAKVAELQGDYQLYTQKRNEAQVANAMDQQQLVNVAIAERPTFSATPASPKIGLTLAMGAFTACFLAACTIFFAEMGRDTVASPFELEALSGAPVLATVPLLRAAPSHSAGSPAGQDGHSSRTRQPTRAASTFTPLTAQRSRLATDPEHQKGIA